MPSDWATYASLATAAGTLILAVATFASIRSGRRSTRIAERALLANTQPVLAPSRYPDDPEQKVMFMEEHWVRVPPGGAVVEPTDEVIYFAMSLRNVGNGLGVLHGWAVFPQLFLGEVSQPDPKAFVAQRRDLYIPANNIGFWQAALRDPAAPEFAAMRQAVDAHQSLTVDLLYGDHEGSQRYISRFLLIYFEERGWIASVGRYWNVDRPQPRPRS